MTVTFYLDDTTSYVFGCQVQYLRVSTPMTHQGGTSMKPRPTLGLTKPDLTRSSALDPLSSSMMAIQSTVNSRRLCFLCASQIVCDIWRMSSNVDIPYITERLATDHRPDAFLYDNMVELRIPESVSLGVITLLQAILTWNKQSSNRITEKGEWNHTNSALGKPRSKQKWCRSSLRPIKSVHNE